VPDDFKAAEYAKLLNPLFGTAGVKASSFVKTATNFGTALKYAPTVTDVMDDNYAPLFRYSSGVLPGMPVTIYVRTPATETEMRIFPQATFSRKIEGAASCSALAKLCQKEQPFTFTMPPKLGSQTEQEAIQRDYDRIMQHMTSVADPPPAPGPQQPQQQPYPQGYPSAPGPFGAMGFGPNFGGFGFGGAHRW